MQMGGGFDPYMDPSFNSFSGPGRSDFGMGGGAGRSEPRGSSRSSRGGGGGRGAPFVEPVKTRNEPAPYVDPFAADPYSDPFAAGPMADPFGAGLGPVPDPFADPFMDP